MRGYRRNHGPGTRPGPALRKRLGRGGAHANNGRMAPDVLLEAREISRRYGVRPAVHGVNLTLRRGDCLGLLGLNGAGKSTTLKMLVGVLAPHAGQILICGVDLARQPLLAKRDLGYLPQTPPLFLDARVDDYLAFCAALHQARDPAVQIARAKQRCGLNDVGRRVIGNLSKGYQQRIGFAQAIVHQPAVLVLDEPTVGLDPLQIREIRTLMRELAREHAVILSTHLLAEVQQICTRVAVLHQGVLVHEGALVAAELRLQLTLREASDDAAARLLEIAGVSTLDVLAEGVFRLGVERPAVAEAIIALAVAHGWGVRELRGADSALEQTFVALTAGAAA